MPDYLSNGFIFYFIFANFSYRNPLPLKKTKQTQTTKQTSKQKNTHTHTCRNDILIVWLKKKKLSKFTISVRCEIQNDNKPIL